MADIITIAGSPSASSRSAAVLGYAREQLTRRGLRTAAITVRDIPAEDLVLGRVDSPAVRECAAAIGQARAVIISTPVYKAAYSGVLKAFLDLLPMQALAGKLVLPIATGGSPAHMLAIDYALRPVLASLGGPHVLQGVYIIDSQIRLDGADLQLDPAIAERLDGALSALAAALPPALPALNGRHTLASQAA